MEKPQINNWYDFATETFYEIGRLREKVEEIEKKQKEGYDKNQEVHKEISDRVLIMEISKKSTWGTITTITLVIATIIGWLIALGLIKIK